ncbi:MAG: hypothetical protein ACK56F_29330, partial [bacterium]
MQRSFPRSAIRPRCRVQPPICWPRLTRRMPLPLGQSGLRRKLGFRRGTRHCRRLLVEQPHLRDFKNSPEIIRLVVRRHVRHALALSKVEDQLHERGIENAWN